MIIKNYTLQLTTIEQCLMVDSIERQIIKLKKKLVCFIVILLFGFLMCCNLYSSEFNSKYTITENEKILLQEKALNLVRGRTYYLYNKIDNEYIENNFYFLEINSVNGKQFKIKFDLAQKDNNGNYMMYIE